MNFHDALNTVTADLTPQPWHYTDNGTTLTVIPAGLPDDPGMAEVLVRITLPGGADSIEAGITTADLPGVIDALTGNRLLSYETLVGAWCELTPFGGGGMLLSVTEDLEAVEAQPQIHIPETERMPLASALSRALDVARGWES